MKKIAAKHFLKQTARRGVVLTMTAEAKAGTLKALSAIRKLFGTNGENWIQGEERRTRGNIHQFCLVGAAKEADGAYERAAHVAIAVAISRSYENIVATPRRLSQDTIIVNYNDGENTTWRDVLAILKSARQLVRNA